MACHRPEPVLLEADHQDRELETQTAQGWSGSSGLGGSGGCLHRPTLSQTLVRCLLLPKEGDSQ